MIDGVASKIKCCPQASNTERNNYRSTSVQFSMHVANPEGYCANCSRIYDLLSYLKQTKLTMSQLL